MCEKKNEIRKNIKKNENYNYISGMNEIINEFIYSNKCTKDAIAELFYELNEDECIYDAVKNKYYTMDENGIYLKDNGELLYLKRKIHDEFYECVKNQYDNELSKQLIDAERMTLIKHKELFIKYTCNVTPIRTIIKKIKEKYKMMAEEYNLDQNENIYAFTNGVYDMTTYEFRKARADEGVYSTCGYEYTPSNNEMRRYVRNIFRGMFPNRERRHNVLDMLALKLNSATNNNECYVLVGDYDDIDIFKKIVCSVFNKFATLLNDGIPKKLVLASRCTSVILVDYMKCGDMPKVLKKVVNNDEARDFEKTIFTPNCSYFMVIEDYKNLEEDRLPDECQCVYVNDGVVWSSELMTIIRSNKFRCALFDILIGRYIEIMG